MIASDFWAAFWPDLFSSLLAGVILLVAAYGFIDKALHLRARAEREEEERRRRRETKDAVLRVVLGELESNAVQLTTALKEMPSGAILYPLFDVALWGLIADSAVFPTLPNETVTALTHAYNRMTTTNEQNAFLSDLNHGQTAILTAAAAAPAIADPKVKEQYQVFQRHRESVRTGVLERLKDLKPFLDGAIDAVEQELGMKPLVAAAQREYQAEHPAGFIGDPETLPPKTRE